MNARVKDIFLDALDVPADQRSAFVQSQCGDDPKLRAEVIALLTAHGAAGEMFHRETATLGVGDDPRPTRTQSPAVGDVIGRFTLLKLLGEGGFGAVFLAEQYEPVVRDVALKVLRVHAHIEEIVERFEAERQVLAIMEHPGIARVYDAGTTADGRPFIAMEYVDGLPITDYAKQNALTLPQRLALFADVCSAVQHAHQKGVIHRDLKPTNILVTTIDGRPVPKVIDFGIAKAIDPEQPISAAQTQAFQIIGTPQYMAPEQAIAGAKDVDTRSDVYSLGTVLYELVAGVPPFDIDRLKRAGLDEICRLIREETPVKPSTRLSSVAGNTQAGSAPRTIAQTLSGSLDREVDWIVMRALEKDRTRRYQSPAELAADIARHLRHEAISAGPPSRIYQLRKFARRNRAAVTAAAVVVTALVAATAISSIMYVRKARAEQAAHASELAALKSERAALQSEQEARHELARATAIADFTRNLLAGIKPSVSRGRDTELMHDLLLRALDTSQETLGKTPDLNLVIRTIISEALYDLGDYKEALRAVKEAYDNGAEAPREDRWRGGIAITNALIDDELPDQASAMADQLTREIEAAGMSSSPIGLELKFTRVALANNNDQFDSAEKWANEIIDELKRKGTFESRLGMRTLNAIGISQLQRNQAEKAAATWTDALPIMKRVLGADDPLVISMMGNLASVLMDLGRNDESAEYHREALEKMRRLYRDDHPVKITMLANFAYFLTSQKQYDQAVKLLEEAEANVGKLDPFDGVALGIQGQFLSTDEARGRWDLYVARCEKLMKMAREKFGPGSPRGVGSAANYIRGMVRLGRAPEAISFAESLGDPPAPEGTAGRAAQNLFAAMGQAYLQVGRVADARRCLAQSVDATSTDLGIDGKPFRGRSIGELERALAAVDRGEPIDLTAPTTRPATQSTTQTSS